MDIKQNKTIPNEYESLMDQATAHIGEMKLDDAMSHLTQAILLETARPEAYNLIGAVMEMHGDVFLAQKYYRAALSFDPSYVPSQKNLTRTASWHREGQIVLCENSQKQG